MNEYEIQCKLVEWLASLIAEGHNIKFTAIPNSTYTNSFSAKARNIKTGLRPGLPDMFLIVNNKAFFLELKIAKGKLSEHQKSWIEAINQTEIKAYTAYSLKEAKKLIIEKLEL